MASMRVNEPRVFCMVVSDGKAGLFLLMPSCSSLAPGARVPPTRYAGPPALRCSRGLLSGLLGLILAGALVWSSSLTASASLQSPEQFIGFKVGADNKLMRWDKIVEDMKLASAGEDPRPPHTARAQAVLPGRHAEPRRARRDLPPGQDRAARHVQRARQRNRSH